METTTRAVALGSIALQGIIRGLIVPAVALLLMAAGYRPQAAARTAPAPAPAPAAQGTPLRVRELRQMARAAGHRALARNGRRAELLAVLAIA